MWRSTRTANRLRCRVTRSVIAAALAAAALAFSPVHGGEADVIDVKATKTGERSFRFDVTVRHKDTGWDHYADRWEVLGPDRKVLATRVLYHPHVEEQPFTRSLNSVRVPIGVTRVIVRARDKVHEFGGIEKSVALPK